MTGPAVEEQDGGLGGGGCREGRQSAFHGWGDLNVVFVGWLWSGACGGCGCREQ